MSAASAEPSFGQRVVARTLDGVVVAWAAASLGALFGYGAGFGVVVALIYEGLATQFAGATIGKVFMGLRITTVAGHGVSGAVAAARLAVVAAGPAVVVFGVPAVIGTAWVAAVAAPVIFGPSHRGIHDRATDTLVLLAGEQKSPR